MHLQNVPNGLVLGYRGPAGAAGSRRPPVLLKTTGAGPRRHNGEKQTVATRVDARNAVKILGSIGPPQIIIYTWLRGFAGALHLLGRRGSLGNHTLWREHHVREMAST
jgi:hypothetical protein